jgi:hypothetical protein
VIFEVFCHFCPEVFRGQKITDAMTYRRVHEEQYHRDAKVETDTSVQR